MCTGIPSYRGHRYPVEIIDHCVWLYFRFPLSFRDVEELILERGVVLSYETIPRWCAKLGQAYANQLRRRRARPGHAWHLDDVFIRINGTQHGGRSISMATFSMCSFSHTEMRWRPRSSSGGCTKVWSMFRG